MLTMREYQIVNKILSIKRSIRIQDLSDEFQVSSRTIKYDLENVRCFLTMHNVNFRSQSNKGIWVECADEQRQSLINELGRLHRDNLYFNQEARTIKILLFLFLNKDFVTASEIALHLNVSRNTIQSDFETIDKLLEESSITLLRKPRTGYKLEGDEIDLRIFIEGLIQKTISLYDVYKITERIKTGNSDESLELSLPDLFVENYDCIEKNLIDAFMNQKRPLPKSKNLLSIIIKMLISIIRLKMGFTLGSLEVFDIHEQNFCNLYPCMKEIYVQNELPLLKDEFLYLQGKFPVEKKITDIAALATQIIRYVSIAEEFSYDNDTELYFRLLSHLTLSLTDESSNQGENPYNGMIKKNHSSLFLSIKKVCAKYMGRNPLLSNESFISYIALHFLLTKKYLSHEARKLKVVFVCSTGRGAARLIEKSIESEIREIEITMRCSLMEVEEVINKCNPDFIISVFPIKSHIPVIVVEPLPTKEDIHFIKTKIKEWTELGRSLEQDNCDMLSASKRISNYDSEESSLEVIMSGLAIYNKLMSAKKHLLKHDLKIAFLNHVLFLAHRCFFGKQYIENDIEFQRDDMEKELKEIFDEMNISIEPSEIIALRQYFI